MMRSFVYCGTVVVVVFLLVVGGLLYAHRDPSSLIQLVTLLTSSSGIGAWFYANRAAKQTNGTLDARIQEAVNQALDGTKVVKTDGGQVLQRTGLDSNGGTGHDGGKPPN